MDVKLIKELPGHKEPVYKLIRFDEDHFLSASGDGIIAKWNIHTYESSALAKCRSGVYAICLLNNKKLAIGTNEGIFHILDYSKKEIIHTEQLSNKQIFEIDFLKSENRILIGDGEGQLTIVNSETYKQTNQVQLSTKSLRSIALNKNESLMAVGNSNDNIHIFSIPELHRISTLKKSENSVFCLQFIDDTTLLSGGRDAHLRIWDVIEKEQIEDIPAHQFTVNDIDFHENDEYFASSSRDKSFKIWQKNEFRLVKVVNQQKFPSVIKHSVNTVLWMNNMIICGGDDRKILIWEVDFT